MPLHDYECPHCGAMEIDVYRSVEEGGQRRAPECLCGTPMVWIPQVGAIDAFEPGQEFTVYDGRNQPRLIESMAQMKALERESEQQARNGEGQPLRFRALHQRQSNMLDNTFGEPPSQRPTAEGKRKFGLQGALKRYASEPSVTFGPAVNESNCSALKE